MHAFGTQITVCWHKSEARDIEVMAQICMRRPSVDYSNPATLVLVLLRGIMKRGRGTENPTSVPVAGGAVG